MRVFTNNPLAAEKLKDTYDVRFFDCTFGQLLIEVRNEIHKGCRLLSHPLSGSVKPNETPYKSVLVTQPEGGVDLQSLELIENSIRAAEKFPVKYPTMPDSIRADFRLIDYTLLQSALQAATDSL